MGEYKDYREIIKEAELLASTPEMVVAYLRERGERPAANRWGEEQIETALLALNHPLIDITLARYCCHAETARALFFREPPTLALRLAVLSNRVLGELSSFFPESLFGDSKDKFACYLAGASDEELYALFENPKLSDTFLTNFLKGDQYWKAMREEKRLIVIAALHSNERMKTRYNENERGIDGWAEHNHDAVFDAAWKLAEASPTTSEWARALRWLYAEIVPDSFSIKEPLELAARWFPQDQALRLEVKLDRQEEAPIDSGTVEEIVKRAVVEACRFAEIHEVIEGLPQGYQTELGEHGVGLSGGQRQRLAIARALLKRPQVLVFDEATSNLDEERADLFAATVNRMKGHATVLFIAHQLPKALSSDAILNLQK